MHASFTVSTIQGHAHLGVGMGEIQTPLLNAPLQAKS